MKKIFSVLLAAVLAAGTMVLPTAAADGDIVYLQTFDDVASYDDLGWEIVETLTTNTSTYTVENGALTVDNLGGNDSYTVVVPASVMDDVNTGDYTVGYDFTLLESGDTARYLAMLLNYDREVGNTYNSLHMRMKGYADWQNRFVGTWSTNMDLNGGYQGLPVFTAKDDGAISNRLFGLAYDETKNVIAGQTIRYEMRVCNSGKYVEVYMNGVLISGTDEAGYDQFTWASEDYSEICLKSGGSILGTVDNIVVVKGLGIPEGTLPEMSGAAEEAPAAEASAFAPVGNVSVPYAAPKVDGVINADEYPADGKVIIDASNATAGGWLGEVPAANSIELYCAWDDTNFYLAGNVTDPAFTYSTDGAYDGDSFQVSLNVNNVFKTDDASSRAIFYSWGVQEDGKIDVIRQESSLDDTITDTGMGAKSDKGWTFEVALPLEILAEDASLKSGEDIAIEAGTSIGGLFCYLDKDETNTLINAYATSAAETVGWDPAAHGLTFVFAEEVVEETPVEEVPAEGAIEYAHYVASANDPYFAYENTIDIDPEVVTWAQIKYRTITEKDSLDNTLTGQIYITPAAEPFIPVKWNHTQNWETIVVDLTSVSETTTLTSLWKDSLGLGFRLDPMESNRDAEANTGNDPAAVLPDSAIDIAYVAFFESEDAAKAYDGVNGTPAALVTADMLAAPSAATNGAVELLSEVPAAPVVEEEPAAEVVEETPAEETVEEAPAAAEVVEEAPQTFDFGVAAAIAAIASLAGFAVSRKR